MRVGVPSGANSCASPSSGGQLARGPNITTTSASPGDPAARPLEEAQRKCWSLENVEDAATAKAAPAGEQEEEEEEVEAALELITR